jgi:putative membrane protein
MVGQMSGTIDSTSGLLLHAWEIHPSVVIGCLALVVWYFFAPRRVPRRAVSFLVGIFILCLSLISPIDPLGDEYLFSAHMLQHLLLIQVVPPLLIAGMTPRRVTSWLSHKSIRRVEGVLRKPSLAWSSNMLMMVVWHLPALYNAANASTAIHILEHLSFLVTGCMFWWPIFTPMIEERLHPAKAMFYLFSAAVVSTLLGIIITFLPVGLYKPYLNPVDSLGALHLIRENWGISAVEDQKLAGLLMWVPGCSVYFIVMLMELARWFRTPEADKQALMAAVANRAQEVQHG